MALTTLDGMLGGNQPLQPFLKKGVATPQTAGRPYSLWAATGIPGPGAYDTTLAGVALSSTSAMVAGQIPHVDPGSGISYLSRFAANCSTIGTLMLCDRLWHNGNISFSSTSAQTVTSATWPARDNTGTTNGVGVYIGMEISGAMGAATPTITLTYTNSAGTGSKTATNIDATVSAAVAGTFYRIGLASGDLGVKSIQSVTMSASSLSGTMNLVAYRILTSIELPVVNVQDSVDALTSGFPPIYNGSVPFLLWIPNAASAVQLAGTYTETQG